MDFTLLTIAERVVNARRLGISRNRRILLESQKTIRYQRPRIIRTFHVRLRSAAPGSQNHKSEEHCRWA